MSYSFQYKQGLGYFAGSRHFLLLPIMPALPAAVGCVPSEPESAGSAMNEYFMLYTW